MSKNNSIALSAILLILFTLLPITPLLSPALVYASNGPDSEVSISNGILTVYIESEAGYNGIGTYTICTGPNHPIPNQDILFDGVIGDAWSSYNTIIVNETKRVYVTSSNPTIEPDSGYTLINLDDNFTSISSTPKKVTIKWMTIEGLNITQEIEVLGSTVADTYVRITMTIKNQGNQPYTVGVRYLWDLKVACTDGSWLRTADPSSSWLSNEADWVSPDFGYWESTDDPADPTLIVCGSISEPTGLSIPPTPPEKFMFAAWGKNPTPGIYNYSYSFSHIGRWIVGSDYDSAVAYYWEKTVDAGGSWSVTAYLWTPPPKRPVGGFIVDSDLNAADACFGLEYAQAAIVFSAILLCSAIVFIYCRPKFIKKVGRVENSHFHFFFVLHVPAGGILGVFCVP